MSEARILAACRIALSKAGAVVWRNNQGVLPDRNGRPVHFGVCNPGGSDLLGYRSILVTPDMVGTRVAVLLACEVKTQVGKPTSAQRHFLETVRAAGGIAILAHSAEEAVEGLSV
mgnify:CR=1 FL=1